MILFFAENVLVFDGKTPIHNPPEYPETMALVPQNLLAAHMFHILTGCQAMQHLQINPSKNFAIQCEIKGGIHRQDDPQSWQLLHESLATHDLQYQTPNGPEGHK